MKFETPSLTLCKKHGNKEVILSVEQPPRYYNAVSGTGTVTLYIRNGKQYPITITFDKHFPKYKDFSEVVEMTTKKEYQGMYGYRTTEATEEDAKTFNEYVSDIFGSSHKLVKTLK